MYDFGLKAGFLLVIALLTPCTTQAQLIDPNNRCVYQPGSRSCEPIRTPVAPKIDEPPYQAFATAANLNLSEHPTYTEEYFDQRARLYCSLLGQGESMKVVSEVTYPPVVHYTETTRDRGRLEVIILRVGTASMCPTQWAQERQIEATFIR